MSSRYKSKKTKKTTWIYSGVNDRSSYW